MPLYGWRQCSDPVESDAAIRLMGVPSCGWRQCSVPDGSGGASWSISVSTCGRRPCGDPNESDVLIRSMSVSTYGDRPCGDPDGSDVAIRSMSVSTYGDRPCGDPDGSDVAIRSMSISRYNRTQCSGQIKGDGINRFMVAPSSGGKRRSGVLGVDHPLCGGHCHEHQRCGPKPAQGNALGLAHPKRQALKGRYNVSRPFRAGFIFPTKPRALPWVGVVPGLWPSRTPAIPLGRDTQ